ncbi:YceI family protein [Thermomicrobiaceae bacterium CFH 74404]|uniref:YceI family protein n=1 Tax=Thermalbibacter longus TaxID=2951981 RepID=A0AA42B9L8_9BACT|nr:YceI family protein [Thermalbibacter longus]MCM8748517.1 YceI family protein [Thermalbibacter longus]
MQQRTVAPEVTGVARWEIDPVHSEIAFSVRHMMVATVRGRFNQFQGVIEFDPAHPESGRVEVTIDAASIDTRNEQRDNHLRSPDFLNVEQYPTITFVSKRIEPLGDNRFRVVGDLTLRGVTREVALDAEFLGVGKDPWGGERAGFTARTKLNRHDFGASWNVALEAGGFLVGDTLDLTLDIEAVRKEIA